MHKNQVTKERKRRKQIFFQWLRQSRGFTIVQGIAILGVCLSLVAIAYTGYKTVVNTSVANTATFVTSTYTP